MEDVKGDIKLGKIANKANYDPILEDDEFDKYVKDKKILEWLIICFNRYFFGHVFTSLSYFFNDCYFLSFY